MKDLMRNWFQNPQPEESEPAPKLDGESAIRETSIGLAVDLDRLPPDARAQICADLLQQNGFPLFEGNVEHLYTKAATRTTDRCPRCEAATCRQSAHFVYATDAAPRVMLAPAGFFCSNCPTVIVDEEIIKAGMKPGLRFRGVAGIDHGNGMRMDYFRTLNGAKTVYILDEDQRILGLEALDANRPDAVPAIPSVSSGKSQRRNRRRQMAKQSRRRNRRR